MKLRQALAHGVSVLILTLAAASPARADVQVSMQNGRVTLVAKNATLAQILAEWARVGQTKIVNGERAPGGPVTLTLTDVPEAKALDILLRPLSGYMAAPRPVGVANLSQFDRVVIMPTLATPPTQNASTGAPPPPMFQQPGMGQQLPFAPQATQPGDDQEDAPPGPRNGPVFNTFPPPQVVNPVQAGIPTATPGVIGPPQGQLILPQPQAPNQQAPAPAAAYPGAPTASPTGVSVPGMIMAPPPQPGQPVPPRRPGGPGTDD